MSEEEKKIKNVQEMFEGINIKNIDEQSITIYGTAILDVIEVLNLIETQQKEMKKLKEKNKSIAYNYEMVVDKLENSTPKDKIKAKIKEYKKQIEELKDSQIFTQTEYEGGIKFGQSLLEEE